MKKGFIKTLYGLSGLVFCLALPQCLTAQVARYDKTKTVGHTSFNYPVGGAGAQQVRDNNDIHIVFSDRSHNKAYAEPYAQRVLSEQKMGSPFYVIGEKNGYYKVVAANQELLGQPKGLFAPLYSGRTHFKDAKKSPFVGWIDKNAVLEFNHSFVSKDNNFPLRYRVGATRAARLSDLKTFFTKDSLNLYNDPFFLEKTKGKLVDGQIVYAYKYDVSRQAVLVADRPALSDSLRTVLGWVPSDLIAMVGQNRVFLLDSPYPVFGNYQLGSNLLFTSDGNYLGNYEDPRIAINMPLALWDRKKSMMVNAKGEDVSVADLDQLIENSKKMNIHLIFYSQDRMQVRNLLNALQGLEGKFGKASQVRFSATAVSDKGNKHLALTSDFGSWIDFLANATAPNTLPVSGGAGFHAAMNKIFSETPYTKFENNVFIILGTDEFPTFTSEINAEMYTRSATLFLAQMLGRLTPSYQSFVLQSKTLLDNNTSEYMSYAKDYLCASDWSKGGLFTDISTESENAFVLDAPKNGIVTGGFVYPRLDTELTNTGFARVLDSLFVRIDERNQKLVAVSTDAENQYGALRAIPTQEIVNTTKDAGVPVESIEKNNINDLYFKEMLISPMELSTYDEGYLFDAVEMKNLLEGYRALMPYFHSDSLTNQQLFELRRNFKLQSDLVNRLSYRTVLKNKSSISSVFYHRLSVPSSDVLNNIVRVKDITRKKCDESKWEAAYKEMLDRLVDLESRFKSGRLRTVLVAGKTYYFVPIKEVP